MCIVSRSAELYAHTSLFQWIQHPSNYLISIYVSIVVDERHLLFPVVVPNDPCPDLRVHEHRLGLRVIRGPMWHSLQSVVVRIKRVDKRDESRHDVECILGYHGRGECKIVEHHVAHVERPEQWKASEGVQSTDLPEDVNVLLDEIRSDFLLVVGVVQEMTAPALESVVANCGGHSLVLRPQLVCHAGVKG